MAVAKTNDFYAVQNHILAIFERYYHKLSVAFLTYKALHGIFNRLVNYKKSTIKWDHRLKAYYLVKFLEVAKAILQ